MMAEIDIVKGVQNLKVIADNINTIRDRTNDITIIKCLREMQNSCSILTDIMEKTFFNMINERERMEDDGK